MKALLDTAHSVASESGRPRREVPELEKTMISVITLAELTIGVLMAEDAELPTRLATLSTA